MPGRKRIPFVLIYKKGDEKPNKGCIGDQGRRFSRRYIFHFVFSNKLFLEKIPYAFPFNFIPSRAAFFEVETISFSENVQVSMGLKSVDRKSTRLNSSHVKISYAVFCLKKKKNKFNIILTKNYGIS